MVWKSNSDNTKMGDKNEKQVLDWLESIGYTGKLYRTKNGGAQIKVYSGDNRKYIYPDIEVFVNGSSVDIKYLVEVKSIREPHLQRDDYIRNIRGEKIDKEKFGVGIHCKNFNSYMALLENYWFDVRIVFIVESTGQWYWEEVDKLNSFRRYSENLFGDGEDCYFWRFSSLRTDFKNR